MAVEFVRNPKNIGINKTTEPDGYIVQHTLAVIGFECYLTVDIKSDGSVVNEYYSRKQSEGDGEDIFWVGCKDNDAPNY